MFRTTREFATALESAGELRRIKAPVSPILEIAAIADRVSKSRCYELPSAPTLRTDPRFHDRGGVALLFENVEGSRFPVLINAFGSYRRMEVALGCHGDANLYEDGHISGGYEGLAAKIAEFTKPAPPRSIAEALAMLRRFAPLLKIAPQTVRKARCQEIVYQGDSADLSILPIIKCWPLDGDFESLGYPADVNDGIPGVDSRNENIRGRYITLAHIHTIHPDDEGNPKPASHNIGMYRVQRLGRSHMAMHWHMHHDGAAHWRAWKARGKRMPVAIALGGESVLPFAATAPLPPGISELLLAGFLNREGIPMVRAKTVPIRVPANSEIVIEGFVSNEAGHINYDPRTDGPLGPGAVFEGPFGDHTGYYSMPDRYPIMEVTAITHRRDPIYPTTIVGLPPQEDYYLGKATERIFRPLLKTLIPDIEDYHLPLFGAFHNAAFAQINKTYPLHARRVMHACWGAGQMSWTKNIFVVDDDANVHDALEVLRLAGQRCHPARDLEITRGPLDILDHASPALGAGTKLGFDCTRKIRAEESPAHPIDDDTRPHSTPDEEDARLFLESVRAIDGVADASMPDELGHTWLFVSMEKHRDADAAAMIDALLKVRTEPALPPRYIVLLDASVNIDNIDEALFHWCANCDAGRDMVIRADRACFDATSKSPRPASDDADGDHPGRGWPVRAWPPIIQMSREMLDKVESRWDEYGIGQN